MFVRFLHFIFLSLIFFLNFEKERGREKRESMHASGKKDRERERELQAGSGLSAQHGA